MDQGSGLTYGSNSVSYAFVASADKQESFCYRMTEYLTAKCTCDNNWQIWLTIDLFFFFFCQGQAVLYAFHHAAAPIDDLTDGLILSEDSS